MTSICKGKILSVLQKHPELNIRDLAAKIQIPCQEPITITKPYSISLGGTVRPLHPTLKEIEELAGPDLVYYVALKDDIIGIMDKHNGFYIVRPESVNNIKLDIPVKQFKN